RRMGVPAAGDGSFGGTQLPLPTCSGPLDTGQHTGTGVTQVHPSTGEFGRFEDRGGRVRGTGWFGAHSCPHWVGAWSVKQGSCVLTHDPTAPFTLDIRSRTPPMTRYRKTFGPKGQILGGRCSTCGRMAVVWTSYQASGSAGSPVKAKRRFCRSRATRVTEPVAQILPFPRSAWAMRADGSPLPPTERAGARAASVTSPGQSPHTWSIGVSGTRRGSGRVRAKVGVCRRPRG